MAERFFDDDTGPLAVLFLGEAGLTELLHDGREKSWSDGEIEKPVASGVDLGGRIFGDFFRKSFAKTLRGEIVAGEADDGELLGEQIVAGKVAERGNELALSQVAGGPEDDHDAGR